MRSDLAAVDSIQEIETDLDDKTCRFKIDASVNVEQLLNALADKNNKIAEWSYLE